MLPQLTIVKRYTVTQGVLEYSVPFPVYESTDVMIKWSAYKGASETLLELDKDYTVVLGNDRDNARVQLNAGTVPIGSVLAIISNIPALQELDLSHTATISSDALELELDIIFQVLQQLIESMERAVYIYAAMRGYALEVQPHARVIVKLRQCEVLAVPRVVVLEKAQRFVIVFVRALKYRVIVRQIHARPCLVTDKAALAVVFVRVKIIARRRAAALAFCLGLNV